MRRNLVVAGWAAAAAVAVAAGVGAVALAQGATLSSQTEPMSEDEVLAELESVEADSSAPGDTPTSEPTTGEPSPSPSGELDQVPEQPADGGGVVLDDTGGSVLARCVDGGTELVWWVADQGWRISSVDPGPDDEAEIEFEGGGQKVDWSVSCSGGEPRAQVDTDDGQDDDDDDD